MTALLSREWFSCAELAAFAQREQEGADGGGAPVRRVEAGSEMPGAVATGEQVGPRRDGGGEVAMDEAGPRRADEPRLELAEIGVVAARDMVEEGHRRGT